MYVSTYDDALYNCIIQNRHTTVVASSIRM